MKRKLFVGVGVIATIGIGLFSHYTQRNLSAQKPFRPPNSTARLRAIGSLHGESRDLRDALKPDSLFAPIPNPKASDWLAEHRETGQTFQQFTMGMPNRPDQHRNTIYLLPVGDFAGDGCPDLRKLEDYAIAFFALKVAFLEPERLEGLPIHIRNRGAGHRQLLTRDVLQWLTTRLPDDAYCMLALTMEDLYPDEKWNFVFGQASLSERVGVYSFARYSPAFYGEPMDQDTESLILLRSCKVLAHETGHMFGIKHCVHFHCLMNGSNNLEESDRQPIHLCPVCLRKLHSSVKFDIVERYKELLKCSEASDWKDESGWLEKRIQRLKFP